MSWATLTLLNPILFKVSPTLDVLANQHCRTSHMPACRICLPIFIVFACRFFFPIVFEGLSISHQGVLAFMGSVPMWVICKHFSQYIDILFWKLCRRFTRDHIFSIFSSLYKLFRISYHILSNFWLLSCIVKKLCYNLHHYALFSGGALYIMFENDVRSWPLLKAP